MLDRLLPPRRGGGGGSPAAAAADPDGWFDPAAIESIMRDAYRNRSLPGVYKQAVADALAAGAHIVADDCLAGGSPLAPSLAPSLASFLSSLLLSPLSAIASRLSSLSSLLFPLSTFLAPRASCCGACSKPLNSGRRLCRHGDCYHGATALPAAGAPRAPRHCFSPPLPRAALLTPVTS